jgi:hypothetical protein
MIFYLIFSTSPWVVFTYSQAGKAFRSLERDLLPLLEQNHHTHLRSSEKSMEISGNGQGVFRNQPLPKVIRKTADIPGVNGLGKGRIQSLQTYVLPATSPFPSATLYSIYLFLVNTHPPISDSAAAARRRRCAAVSTRAWRSGGPTRSLFWILL